MGVPVYHLYRMRDTPENEPYICQTYEYICRNGGCIHEDGYELVYDQGLLTDGMTITEVHAKLEAKPPEFMKGHSLRTGDVIVLRRGDSISSFFCDICGMVQITGFFKHSQPQENIPLTPETEGYQIPGADGKWNVTDTLTVDDNTFFVLENSLPESVSFKYILDAGGNVVTNCAGNEKDAIARITAWLKKPVPAAPEKEEPVRLSEHARDYVIKDTPGKWAVVETCVVDGSPYYLLENQRHGERMERKILSTDGEVFCNNSVYGFDEAALKAIRSRLHPEEEKKTKPEGPEKRPSVRQRLREKLDIVKGNNQ